MNEDGSFNLLVGVPDIGTGSDTIMAQVAAEVLSVEPNQIIVCSSDTDITPFDSGAYASSTTFISGTAVRKASEEVKQQILRVASDVFEVGAEELKCLDGGVYDRSGVYLATQIFATAHFTRRISFRLWRRHHIFRPVHLHPSRPLSPRSLSIQRRA